MRTFITTFLWIMMWTLLVIAACGEVPWPWNILMLCALLWLFLTIDARERM